MLAEGFEEKEENAKLRRFVLGSEGGVLRDILRGGDVRTIVSVLDDDLDGFKLISECNPWGSSALVDPLRTDNLRDIMVQSQGDIIM